MRIHTKKSGSNKNSMRIGMVCIVCVLILLLRSQSIPSLLQSIGYGVSYPFQKAFSVAGEALRGMHALAVTKQSLERTIEALQQERLQGETLRIENKGLVQENDTLRALIGRAKESYRIARIRSCVSSVLSDACTLDVGSEEGVREGMVVVSEAHAVLGRIERVEQHRAFMRAFSSPSVETTVSIHASSSVVQAQGKGKGNGVIVLSVPRDVAVAKGDIVTLPFLGTYSLGVVEDSIGKPEDSHKEVFVKGVASLYDLSYVLVDLYDTNAQ